MAICPTTIRKAPKLQIGQYLDKGKSRGFMIRVPLLNMALQLNEPFLTLFSHFERNIVMRDNGFLTYQE